MFGTIVESFKNTSMLMKIVILAVLAIVGWYAYNMFFASKSNAATTKTIQGPTDKTLRCTMFYAPWCGACKNAHPEWDHLEHEFNGKVMNGTKILITKIDCEENKEIADQEDIEAYPTFKFDLNGKYFDYPDEPTFEKFKTFIEFVLGRSS